MEYAIYTILKHHSINDGFYNFCSIYLDFDEIVSGHCEVLKLDFCFISIS